MCVVIVEQAVNMSGSHDSYKAPEIRAGKTEPVHKLRPWENGAAGRVTISLSSTGVFPWEAINEHSKLISPPRHSHALHRQHEKEYKCR